MEDNYFPSVKKGNELELILTTASPTSTPSPKSSNRSPLLPIHTGSNLPLSRDRSLLTLAISRLSELLKHPDDLDSKIELLRHKLTLEKNTVEIQLKTDVQGQFDDIMSTFNLLAKSKERLLVTRNGLENIYKMGKDNQTKIGGYDIIKELSRVHSNMVDTDKYVQRFKMFQHQLHLIESLLSKDEISTATLPDYVPQILPIHYELYHCEEFRDITMHYSKRCNQDVTITLKGMFKSVDSLSNQFLNIILQIGKDMYKWMERGILTPMLHVIKIIECEEMADKKAIYAEQARTHTMNMTNIDSKNRWKLANGSPRKIKNLKTLFINGLREAIGNRIENHLQGIENDDIMGVLDRLDDIPSDLKELNETVCQVFPKEYHIFEVFLSEYHLKVYQQLEILVNNDIDKLKLDELFRVMRFIQDYHLNLNELLNVSEDSLEPTLLGGNQQKLVEGCLTIVSNTLFDWISIIIQQDINIFMQRDKEPYANVEGIYYLSTSSTAFESFDGQIKAAADANSARILVEVIKTCAKMAQIYQQRLNSIMHDELERYLSDPSSISQGFVEYTIALMNDQLRSVDQGEPLSINISAMLHDVYKDRALSFITDMSDGYFKLASSGIDVIIKVIFFDIQHLFDQLYTSVWYDEDLMLSVVATFEDYLSDLKLRLNPFLFNQLIDQLIEHTLIYSILPFQNKSILIDPINYLSKSELECNAFTRFFSQFIDDSVIATKFQPLVKLHHLACSNNNLILMEFYPLKKTYPDLPLSLLESIISKRLDLDKKQKLEIIDNLRLKENDLEFIEINNIDSNLSIFSKLMDKQQFFKGEKSNPLTRMFG